MASVLTIVNHISIAAILGGVLVHPQHMLQGHSAGGKRKYELSDDNSDAGAVSAQFDASAGGQCGGEAAEGLQILHGLP